jgi:NADH-quinone oxidoreductase subunit L
MALWRRPNRDSRGAAGVDLFGRPEVGWTIGVDTLTAVMLVVVNTVSAFVHLYSIGYMEEDPHRPRFFAYLSLFTFAMLMLVTADNLAQLFFGWEGVGLASYLLIGFWYHKPEANAAAIKAFVVNRVGDFGFALGIFGVFMMTGAVDLDTVIMLASSLTGKTINSSAGADAHLICLLLFMGAMGKSAQFLLHLAARRDGAPPVSALIHAATMVTAGVFMVARLCAVRAGAKGAGRGHAGRRRPRSSPQPSACLGLTSKRVVAYSTCSQLGYMFVAMGSAPVQSACTPVHRVLKALLFLGSGSVIHAMHHEQDMRRMGGLRDKLPVTYVCMLVGTLALTGFPLTAGYFSKDAIIEAAAAGHNPFAPYAFVMTVVAALLTSFYSWRLVFMTFHGEPADRQAHKDAHESPWVILIPLIFLAAGSVLAGFPFKELFAGDHVAEFFRESLKFGPDNHILHDMHELNWSIPWVPTVMMAMASSSRSSSISAGRTCRGASPRSMTCCTASCSTSGTSTRSTTSCSSGRRSGSAACCGRAGTAR